MGNAFITFANGIILFLSAIICYRSFLKKLELEKLREIDPDCYRNLALHKSSKRLEDLRNQLRDIREKNNRFRQIRTSDSGQNQDHPNLPNKIPEISPLETDISSLKTEKDWFTEWDNRIKRHRKACQIYRDSPNLIEQYQKHFQTGYFVPWQIEPMSVIDKNHKALYCALPKSGSTNWKLTIRMMEELNENSSFVAKKQEGDGMWHSRKDVEGYRIRRDTQKLSDHQRSSTIPEYSTDSHLYDNDTNLLFDPNTGIPTFDYKNKYLEQDIYEHFEWSGSRYHKTGKFGHFPISAVPPSLRSSLGRFGINKVQRGYPYKDRIGIYSNGTYTKILFVRHPIERLLSAYRDKAQPGFFKSRAGFGRSNMRRSLRQLMVQDINGDKDLLAEKLTDLDRSAFGMFLAYVINRGGENSGWTGITVRHWGRAYDLCRICSINWDFIGKMGPSVEKDSEQVMKMLGVEGKIHLGLHPPSNDHSKVIKYFKGLPKNIMMGVYDTYEADFQVLGFDIPMWLWETLSPDI